MVRTFREHFSRIDRSFWGLSKKARLSHPIRNCCLTSWSQIIKLVLREGQYELFSPAVISIVLKYRENNKQ